MFHMWLLEEWSFISREDTAMLILMNDAWAWKKIIWPIESCPCSHLPLQVQFLLNFWCSFSACYTHWLLFPGAMAMTFPVWLHKCMIWSMIIWVISIYVTWQLVCSSRLQQLYYWHWWPSSVFCFSLLFPRTNIDEYYRLSCWGASNDRY